MSFLVMLRPVPCVKCGLEVRALVRTKEEQDSFMCKECSENININTPEENIEGSSINQGGDDNI